MLASLLLAARDGVADSGNRKSVTVMFFRPVTTEDLDFLRAMGGTIKYTNSAINGIGVEMPAASMDKLMTMYQNPSAPQSDPIARNISFIVDDGMPYPFDASKTAAKERGAAVQFMPDSCRPATSGSIRPSSGILPGSMFAFPIMPIVARA